MRPSPRTNYRAGRKAGGVGKLQQEPVPPPGDGGDQLCDLAGAVPHYLIQGLRRIPTGIQNKLQWQFLKEGNSPWLRWVAIFLSSSLTRKNENNLCHLEYWKNP